MTELGLLKLVQWLSPAFPTGGFAYSHGLETEIVAGRVKGASQARDWIGDVLTHGTGFADAVLLAQGLAGGDLDALSDHARALSGSKERLEETLAQGAAFAAATQALGAGEGVARPLPLAVAAAARPLGLPPEQVVGLYLHAFVANLVSAATRFMPLGQSEGQKVLAALHPQVAELAARACATPLAAITTAAFGAELAAMAHETLDVRIFKS